ncbi:hypothetical protein HAX54_034921, partial [Datura stramonium]|nr:hypothetical protein [Datura stramonium]
MALKFMGRYWGLQRSAIRPETHRFVIVGKSTSPVYYFSLAACRWFPSTILRLADASPMLL